ncbi:MAG: hypothetical protein HQL11_03890 [Candidatus Omnitrophica bacterium]|nr:hypothetical protein [Candidatus Omnitrophota bacterium]
MLNFMVDHTDHPTAIRYPRGAVTEKIHPELERYGQTPIELGKPEVLTEGADVLFIALGSMVGPVLEAARYLEGVDVSSTVVNARFVKPFDVQSIEALCREARLVVTVEEGCLTGGFGSAVLESLAARQVVLPNVICLGVPDRFIPHARREMQLDWVGLSPHKIARRCRQALWKIDPGHFPLKEEDFASDDTVRILRDVSGSGD